MHHLLSLEECERQKCQTFLYFLQKGLIYHSGWEKKKKYQSKKKLAQVKDAMPISCIIQQSIIPQIINNI